MDTVPQRRHYLRGLLVDFDAVLAAEYDALRQRNPERLHQVIDDKQRLVAELDRCAADGGGLEPAAADHEAQDEWNMIQRLLSRCALANRTNGAAIDASRAFVTSMLDILTGREASERTYTASGRIGIAASRGKHTSV